MKEQVKIYVTYISKSIDNETISVNELAPSLLALSNLINETNQILNNNNAMIETRVSIVGCNSFKIIFELNKTLAQQFKLFFNETNYSLHEILSILGLITQSRYNLLKIYRWLKGKRSNRVKPNKINKDIICEEELQEVPINVWKLFQSKKIKKYMSEMVHPLIEKNITAIEFRDDKNATEKILNEEFEYFFERNEYLQEFISEQQLMLKIISVSFERGSTWRFDDGDIQFDARINDEYFLNLIESNYISFKSGDSIIAIIETKQQYIGNEIKKVVRTVVKVLQIIQDKDDFNENSRDS